MPDLEISHLNLPEITLLQQSETIPKRVLFIDEANRGITELNKLINQYNQAKLAQKLNILYQIYLKQKEINDALPQNIKSANPEYREKIHHELFKNLQTQFAHLGVVSLQEDYLKARINSQSVKAPDPSALTEILANMAPEKVDRLLEILSAGKKFNAKELESLYQPHEPGYQVFQLFLSTHSISYLGGENSYNFKITHLDTCSSEVLKVEDRLGVPRTIENYLKAHSLKQVIAPIRAQREGHYLRGGFVHTTKTVLITDFYRESDLGNAIKDTLSDEEKIKTALKIYCQMATIVEKIEKDGCAFPDMKNSNWLLDNGALLIADTKSFLFLDWEKKINLHDYRNVWHEFLATPYLIPPEAQYMLGTFSATKMHSYMLGKNIYHFLTNSTKEIEFNHPIFSSPIGQELCVLIKGLTQGNPEKRISLSEAATQMQAMFRAIDIPSVQAECRATLEEIAQFKQGHNDEEINLLIKKRMECINAATHLTELKAIKTQLIEDKKQVQESIKVHELKNECKKTLAQIMPFKFGQNDTEMSLFIETKTKLIDQQTSQDALLKINQELKTLVTKMKQDPVMKAVREIITQFRSKNHFYTIGMKDKALRIEQAMAKVPLEERFTINDGKSSAAKEVLNALASHRHPFRAKPITKDGTINEAKAANSYRLFKAQILPDNPNNKPDLPKDKTPLKVKH